MKNLTLALFLLSCMVTACQPTESIQKETRITTERSPLFEKYDAEKIAVADFFEEYLNIMYDSSISHRNSFWNSTILTSIQDRFLMESLVKEFHLAYPPKIYGIQKTPEHEFLLTVAFSKKGFPFKVMTVKIAKDGLGRFYFIDMLSENLAQFSKYESGGNTYFYSPKVERNKTLEEKTDSFNLSLSNFFDIAPYPVKIIVLKDLRDHCDVLGYVYSPFLTYDGQTGGIALPEEQIIFSANNSPYYPHELVHLYSGNNKFNAHYWFDEGVATYLGGSVEYPLEYHLKKIASQLDSLDFSELPKNTQLDDDTNFKYALGGMFCKLAMEEFGGKDTLMLLLNSGKEEEDFFVALEKAFDIERDELADFVKMRLKKYQ